MCPRAEPASFRVFTSQGPGKSQPRTLRNISWCDLINTCGFLRNHEVRGKLLKEWSWKKYVLDFQKWEKPRMVNLITSMLQEWVIKETKLRKEWSDYYTRCYLGSLRIFMTKSFSFCYWGTEWHGLNIKSIFSKVSDKATLDCLVEKVRKMSPWWL